MTLTRTAIAALDWIRVGSDIRAAVGWIKVDQIQVGRIGDAAQQTALGFGCDSDVQGMASFVATDTVHTRRDSPTAGSGDEPGWPVSPPTSMSPSLPYRYGRIMAGSLRSSISSGPV
jgi:hypothetical protein